MEFVENIIAELEQAHGYLRRLETQNAEIKAEMEAFMLSALELNIANMQIAKREKRALKKTQSLEKQLVKLRSKISKEKQKVSELEDVLAGIKQSREAAEAKLQEELKATNEARAQVIMELLLKETVEAKINKKMEEASIKMEINLQCHQDNICRLEQEISSAKTAAKQQQELVIPSPRSEPKEEVNGGRKCILCETNEVFVLLLPCTHQVMCVTCCDMFQFKSRVCCPICLTPIQQSIHVFRGSSY